MANKKMWLVIEKNTYGEDSESFSVIKYANTIEQAMKFKVHLDALNDRKKQSYFLASDIDPVLENVAHHHNKSVKNGTYYDNHPEVKRPEKKEVEEEILF